MRKKIFSSFIRNFEGGNLMESFLISAVASILIIRTFLRLTAYPSLSHGEFHIAHMLWGGFLMVIALTLLLSFLNREVKGVAAVIGGIGFGTFIDELGKFVTRDNNYFFQPTIAIIYVILILLFFIFRAIDQYIDFTKKEYAINALEFMKEAIAHDLNSDEKKRAMYLLRKSDKNDPVVQYLKQAFSDIDTIPTQQNIISKTRERLQRYYQVVIQDPWFSKLVIWFFVATSLINFFHALITVKSVVSFSQWGQILSTLFSGTFVVIGVVSIQQKKRLLAFHLFRYSLLISILFTQFFLFYRNQLSAISGLLINIVILSIIQYLIYEETLLEKKEEKN